MSRLSPWRTYEEDVEVCQSKPREQEVERIVDGLDHQSDLADPRMVGTPDLCHMDQRVNLLCLSDSLDGRRWI